MKTSMNLVCLRWQRSVKCKGYHRAKARLLWLTDDQNAIVKTALTEMAASGGEWADKLGKDRRIKFQHDFQLRE